MIIAFRFDIWLYWHQ